MRSSSLLSITLGSLLALNVQANTLTPPPGGTTSGSGSGGAGGSVATPDQPRPSTISYKGFLADASGTTPFTGNKDISVAIFNAASGGTALYSESYTAVPVANGRFELALGSAGTGFANLSFTQALWLEITVGGETLSPRVALSTVPYARTTLQIGTQANGKWCTSDGSMISCQQDAPGDIGGVTAGTGLIGGGTSGEVSLALDTAGAITLTGNWVNTANPWADNEVADNLTISGGSISNSSGSFTSLTLADGSQGAGKVLVSDGSGKGAWQTLGGGSVTSVTATAPLSVANGTTAPAISLSGTIPVANGGTGATSLSGYLFGNGTGAVTATATIPASAIGGNFGTLRADTIIGGFSGNSVTVGVTGAFIGGGGASFSINTVTDNYGVVAGGLENRAGDDNGTLSDRAYATVSGGYINTASGKFSAVAGGQSNTASGDSSAVAGGQSNTASGDSSAVAGGDSNTASGNYSAVAGGFKAFASGNYSVVAGGLFNLASGNYSAVAGGQANTASGLFSAVAGGYFNTASGDYSFAGGRQANVNADHDGTFLWSSNEGTNFNSAAANEFAARASGGVRFVAPFLQLDNADKGAGKVLTSDANGKGTWQTPTISAANITGTLTDLQVPDNITVAASAITGTLTDTQVPDSLTITGGSVNNTAIGATTPAAGTFTTLRATTVIAGFSGNAVTAGVTGAFIGGGGASGNVNAVTDNYGVVAGGLKNQAGDGAGTVSDKLYDTVSGGFANTASGGRSLVAGGAGNTASGFASAVLGGENSTASGGYSAVLAGFNTEAGGSFSFAGGRQAKVQAADAANGIVAHDGAFLWSGSHNTDFNSAAANEFAVRATGGVRFRTNTSLSNGCNLAPGGGSWSCTSDRNTKENFAPVNGREVLEKVAAMPIQTWSYKTEATHARHMGPMAQDFRAAFQLGDDDKSIATVDPDGVALAAIQGLNALLQEQRKLIEAQRAEIAELKSQNRRVSERLQRVEAHFTYTQR